MKITANFKLSEFNSKDGAKMPDDVKPNVVKLACNLQRLRNVLKAPITINSGYRSLSHNKAVGGATNSQHLTGKAADIVIQGFDPIQVKETIEELIQQGEMLQGGLKAYSTFVHYDVRGHKARW